MNVEITNKQVRARIFLPFVSHYHYLLIACASLLTSRPLNRSRRESGLTNRDLMLIPILVHSCKILRNLGRDSLSEMVRDESQ